MVNKIDTMGMDANNEDERFIEDPSDWVRYQRILFDVEAEIKAQNKEWGANRRKPLPNWFFIIDEEMGEVARSALDNEPHYTPNLHSYEEMIQVTALCFQVLNDMRLTLGEKEIIQNYGINADTCLLYTSPSPRDS